MFYRLVKVLLLVSCSYLFSGEGLFASDWSCYEEPPTAGLVSQDYTLSYNSTLVRSDNAYSNRYVEASGRLGLNLTSASHIYGFVRGQKLLDDESERFVASEANLGLRWSRCLSKDFTLALSTWYGAPVNQDLRKYDHSHGQIATRAVLQWATPIDNLLLSFNPTVRRHFYRYTDNSGGKILRQWSFEPWVNLSYSYGDLSFSADFIDVMGWDFDGEQMRSVYYHEEAISYQITKEFSIYVSHRSDGYIANYGGTAADINLYDGDKSEIALGLGYSL